MTSNQEDWQSTPDREQRYRRKCVGPNMQTRVTVKEIEIESGVGTKI